MEGIIIINFPYAKRVAIPYSNKWGDEEAPDKGTSTLRRGVSQLKFARIEGNS